MERKDPERVQTLAVLLTIALLGGAGWWLWSVREGRRRAAETLTRRCPGLTDRLEGRDITVLFSATEQVLGLASHRLKVLLPFASLRKWRAEPVYKADRRTGWTFIIETNDPKEPIWTIRLKSGPSTAVPNFWMAKFGAYLDRG